MSKNVEIELNLQGLNALMKSAEIQSAVQTAGQAVAAEATAMSGEEYDASTHLADYVAIANVYPTSKAAAKDNRDNNTLLKATGAVGLPTSKPHL